MLRLSFFLVFSSFSQREPKTQFIFEPNDGVMILEQKLPMSWHAFNETPNFRVSTTSRSARKTKKFRFFGFLAVFGYGSNMETNKGVGVET